jgi:hypothetical protein
MIIPTTIRYGHIPTCRQKRGKQFLDFIDRIDQKYDFSVKQIFLVLDNVSIHKSNNKVKETRQVSSKNTPCISSNKITRTQSDRSQMVICGCIDKP